MPAQVVDGTRLARGPSRHGSALSMSTTAPTSFTPTRLLACSKPRLRSPSRAMHLSGGSQRRSLAGELMLAYPGLCGHLHGVPGGAEWRGVGQVELADLIDAHPVEQGGGVGVDALGSLGAARADELRAEQRAGVGVTGDADGDRLRARVIGLVVIGRGGAADRTEPGGDRFVLAQPGARRDQVEDLDDLGAEAAGEAGVSAQGALAGDAALLVGGGAQRQVGAPELAVMGDHAVAGRPDV